MVPIAPTFSSFPSFVIASRPTAWQSWHRSAGSAEGYSDTTVATAALPPRNDDYQRARRIGFTSLPMPTNSDSSTSPAFRYQEPGPFQPMAVPAGLPLLIMSPA